MIELVIDVEDLVDLERGLANIEPRLKSMAAESANVGGARLYQLAERGLAQWFRVPQGQASIALDFSLATEQLPTYTLTASNEDFPYFRWITQRDEKVCKICGPRDGRTFHLFETYEIYPAHPNCRCRLERLEVGAALLELAPTILPEPMQLAAEHFLEEFAKTWRAIE